MDGRSFLLTKTVCLSLDGKKNEPNLLHVYSYGKKTS